MLKAYYISKLLNVNISFLLLNYVTNSVKVKELTHVKFFKTFSDLNVHVYL